MVNSLAPNNGYTALSAVPPAEVDDEAKLGTSKRLASEPSSVFNLVNAAIGAGVLAFPFVFRVAGVALAPILILAIVCVSLCTIYVLVSLCDRFHAPSYQALVRHGLGEGPSLFISLLLFIYLFGSCSGYLIIIGDMFQPIMAQATTSFAGDRRFVIGVITLVFIVPLCCLRTIKSLAISSSLTVVAMTYMVIAIIWDCSLRIAENGGQILEEPHVFKFSVQLFETLPLIVFAFNCHIQAVPIFAELQDPSDGRCDVAHTDPPLQCNTLRVARLRSMMKVSAVTLGLCLFFYSTVGIFGYLTFFEQSVEDILKVYDPSDVKISVGRGLIAVVAMASYPINHFPARIVIDEFVLGCGALLARHFTVPLWMRHPAEFSWTRHLLEAFFFIGGTLGVALTIEDLGNIMKVVGSSGGVTLMFIMPACLMIKYFYLYPTVTPSCESLMPLGSPGPVRRGHVLYLVAAVLLIVFSLFVFVSTMVVLGLNLH